MKNSPTGCQTHFQPVSKADSLSWSKLLLRRLLASTSLYPQRIQGSCIRIQQLQQPHMLYVESAEELAIKSWSTSPQPLRPSVPPSQSWTLLAAMMNDSSSQRKELTHRCISAPYFQSGQELNGFTNSLAFCPAIATILFRCWICKRRKYSIEMHCCTLTWSHGGLFISLGCS